MIQASHWNAWIPFRLIYVTALFVLASIAVYVLNDIVDRDRDRLHPRKRLRPLAAGDITPATAYGFLAAVCVLLCAGTAVLPPGEGWPVWAYTALNLAYSLRLKHVPLVEAFAVAAGFVLRVLAGYAAIGLRPSPWLLLSVLTGCLLLVLGKRRKELADGATEHRPVLGGYSVPLLDHLILMSATLSAVGYLLFLRSATSSGHDPVVLILLSAPCALFALFRYLQLLMVEGGGGDPSATLLRDRPLLASGVLWATVVVLSLVFFDPRVSVN